MQIQALLKNFGLNDKEIAVYTALIEFGPNPVRVLAQKSGVNRGTTYDILKSLIEQGLVSYHNKDTHQYFAAESPEKLIAALEERVRQTEKLKQEIEGNLPEIKSLFEREGGRPQIKLFEGAKGIKQILNDVLQTMDKNLVKKYYVYSSANVRKNIYLAMPDFTDQRIKKKITVQTIALGEGGTVAGLDERKWMKNKEELYATYEIIYSGKVAHISLDDAQNPVGVVIENEAIYVTQKMIFEFNWSKL